MACEFLPELIYTPVPVFSLTIEFSHCREDYQSSH